MSCSDVQTIKAGNGSQLTFSFDFPYIFKSEIHVYFWNATTKEYDEKLTTDSTYPWRITDANPTIVEFTGAAPPAPATPVDPGESAVDNVKIRRITKVDDIRALFNPGSAIRSDDLNKNFEQLRYAIQESNCQGIPDDVDQYLKDYYWDRYDNTLYNGDTWVSDDTKIATTAALDARFQDEVNDTLTKAELAAASNTMPDDDVAVPTTGSLKNYVDHVVETDILVNSTGLTKTATGGQVTLGIGEGSVDLDRIKPEDIITYSEQNAGSQTPADTSIFTSSAAARRFDTIVQTSTPSGSDWQVGKTWLQNDADKTLSVWDGDSWEGISSGGTFTSQAKVVYVDATNGNDANDGHRISRPKATIKAAIDQINNDATYGDGSIVIVAPGVYQEVCPIQIQKRDVAIVGTALRQCVIHPTAATETATMFEVNSGSYLKNLTFTGMKAGGTRGATGSLWENATYGLPPTQGWNVAFYNNAYIYKSPYIQNCTNFSDSEIDNTNLGFYDGDTDKGRAGDLDSAPTGGGLLVDGSTPHQNSPLRSIVCDSYTHTGLDAPGIFVTNNGYVQATSSYAFFNHAHITCINGGQANLAASTSDFGRYGLIASGKSSAAIFTSTIDGAVSDGAISFNIDAPTAGAGWHGSATRPAGNQLVTVNSVTYPILSAVANGSGWTVTISRPDPNNRSTNLGVNGAISDGAAVSFFLRSMIASSGHTMEYVGSGTDYRALPENGGVPNDANQKIELDDGKIWTATTDQNGKFTIGGNQTDDPFFEVDQQLGYVTIPEGSIAFNLLSDLTPQLGGDLDVNGNEITSASNGNVTINPNGTGDIVLDADVGINSTAPRTKLSVLNGSSGYSAGAGLGSGAIACLESNGNVGLQFLSNSSYSNYIYFGDESSASTGSIQYSHGANALIFGVNGGTERMRIDSSGRLGIGTSSPSSPLHISSSEDRLLLLQSSDANAYLAFQDSDSSSNAANRVGTVSDGLYFNTGGGGERMRIDSSGNVGIGVTPTSPLHVKHATFNTVALFESGDTQAEVTFKDNAGQAHVGCEGDALFFKTSSSGTERMRIDSSGNVGIATSSPRTKLDVSGGIYAAAGNQIQITGSPGSAGLQLIGNDSDASYVGTMSAQALILRTNSAERLRIDSSGNVGIGTTSPGSESFVVQRSGSTPTIRINAASSYEAQLKLQADGTVTDTQLVAAKTDGSLAFARWTGAAYSERMRIDSSGNVGIGTTSPSSLLHLESASSPKLLLVDTTNSCTLKAYAQNSNAHLGTESNHDFIFDTNNTERLRINSSGNVGIGTSSPGHLLTLKGTQAFEATNSTNDWLAYTYTDNTFRLNYNGAGADEVVITSAGNVGIGTSSPGAALHIESSSADAAKLRIGFDSPRYYDIFRKSSDGSGFLNFYGSQSGFTGYVFGGVDGERMRIDSSGRLLIGTTAAKTTYSLEVVQDSGANLALVCGSNVSAANGPYQIFTRSRGSTSSPSVVQNGDTTGVIEFRGYSGAASAYRTNAAITGAIDGTPDSGGDTTDMPGRLVFSTTADGNNSPTERMRIDSSGNVGIGETSPNKNLVVKKANGGGDVGIRIQNDSTNSSGTTASLRFTTSTNDSFDTGSIVVDRGTGAMIFSEGEVEAMRIDSSGRLLVGTSSSRAVGGVTAKFEVEGTGSDSSISLIRNSNNSANPYLLLGKSRGTSVGSSTIVNNNDYLGAIYFAGADGTDLANIGAEILCRVDGTPGSNDMPGRLEFKTSSGSGTTTRMILANDGSFRVQGVYDFTLASSANVHVDSGGLIRRVTSSAKYKTNIETIEDSYADALLNCRPVWYQSTCEGDNPDYGWWGFIAEEVAEIDPRLVHWKTTNVTYDEDGSIVETPCDPEAEGVLYDRFVPHLVNLVKRQQEAIKTLETKVAALEAG